MTSEPGQTSDSETSSDLHAGDKISKLDQMKLDFEREKLVKTLEMEREKLAVEAKKLRWTVVAAVVSVVTIGVGVWNVRKAAEAQLEMKLADTVLISQKPSQSIARGRFIADLMGDQLPEGLKNKLETLKAENYAANENTEPTLDLLRLLADHPKDRATILNDWEALFGGQSVNSLRKAGRKK